MSTQPEREPRYVVITRKRAELDAEVGGGTNQLGLLDNNGRKVLAIERRPAVEPPITSADPRWSAPAVLETGAGGLEVATLSEFSGQDRHKHLKSTEIYTVLRGELRIYLDDEGPLVLHAGDEILILPGTVHEVVQAKRRARDPGEAFELLVRVHAIDCHGAEDKFVQLEPDGEWSVWSSLSKEDKARACRKQG